MMALGILLFVVAMLIWGTAIIAAGRFAPSTLIFAFVVGSVVWAGSVIAFTSDSANCPPGYSYETSERSVEINGTIYEKGSEVCIRK